MSRARGQWAFAVGPHSPGVAHWFIEAPRATWEPRKRAVCRAVTVLARNLQPSKNADFDTRCRRCKKIVEPKP